jgi:hypothetical protein
MLFGLNDNLYLYMTPCSVFDAKHRDEAPHTNCGDGTDDDEGEDHAKGEGHMTFAMRYYPCARCSYERGAEGTGR